MCIDLTGSVNFGRVRVGVAQSRQSATQILFLFFYFFYFFFFVKNERTNERTNAMLATTTKISGYRPAGATARATASSTATVSSAVFASRKETRKKITMTLMKTRATKGADDETSSSSSGARMKASELKRALVNAVRVV